MIDDLYFAQQTQNYSGCYESFSWDAFPVSQAQESLQCFAGVDDLSGSNYHELTPNDKEEERKRDHPPACEEVKVFLTREEDRFEVDHSLARFLGKGRGVVGIGEDVMNDPEPKKPTVQVVGLGEVLGHLQRKSSSLFDHYAAKRREHQKYKDAPPSTLNNFTLPKHLSSRQVPVPTMRDFLTKSLTAARDHIFSCPDFSEASTPSQRHTCMGILADGFRVHMRFVEDLDSLARKMYPEAHFESSVGEKLAFLQEIEKRGGLVEMCRYSVVSKASSAAKSAVRLLYLEILSLKHGTTPSRAQELVPGFTYEHIQSIDEVIDLIETEPDSQTMDIEVEQFRSKISKMKPIGQRLKPVISAEFLQRIKNRVVVL